MTYLRETHKTFAQALDDLQHSITDHGFGILHQYDFRQTLAQKGYPISNDCVVMEICQPKLASEALTSDMRVNLALPCRMSVFTDNNRVYVGMIPAREALTLVSDVANIADIAYAVEQTTRRIVDDAV